ncbi:MAG: MarR family transcriptional regulator [Candidatus Dormibacteraeota bacterium]|nr:MarR family transcriptional regulator [Candidatus Dormibacteraeota bacterium]
MVTSTGDVLSDRKEIAPVPALVRTVIEVLRGSSTVTAALTPVVRRFGLSLAGFNVMHTLAHAEGPLGPSAISRAQVIPAQTLTSVLDSLERRGLVEREANPGDRRMLLARLTDEGAALYRECCEPLLAVESELLSGLSEAELERLRGLLGKIAGA